MPNLIQIIKKAAVEAVEASNPAKVFYGTVQSTSPLSIKINQKFTITRGFLVLTKSAVDNSLSIGDKVILLREQGGQKYIVLDKVGD